MKEAFLLLCWLIYFFGHSILAATRVRLFLTRLFLIKSARGYRIGYNLIALSGLAALLYLQFSLSSASLYQTVLITDGIAFCIMAISLVIMIASIRNYDWKSFVGIAEEKYSALVIKGMNQYVRHPLYSGTMLFASGFFVWQPYYKNLLLWAVMWIYLVIGITFEERKLVKLYGSKYKDYQKNVKRMIPYIW